MSAKIVERIQVESVAVPLNTTGAAVVGTYINMANYERVQFVISQGAWAGGTPAVTLNQAQDSSATGVKACPIDLYWSKATTGTWTKNTITSNTFNLTATASTTTVLEVRADQLDVTNGFNWLSLAVASPGANADYISIVAILTEPRYPQALNVDAKV